MKEDNKYFTHVDTQVKDKIVKPLKSTTEEEPDIKFLYEPNVDTASNKNKIKSVSPQNISKDIKQELNNEQLEEVAGGMGFKEWCHHVSRGY